MKSRRRNECTTENRIEKGIGTNIELTFKA
jgi:hypothetical protein